MPVLAYCLIEAQPSEASLIRGVGDLPVENIEHNHLQCFFSRTSSSDQILALPTKQAALAFHGVVQAIFKRTAVIPFRFPTLLQDEAELLRYMSDQTAAYQEALARLRNMVQMDIELSSLNRPVAQTEKWSASKKSGSEYLKDRQIQQRQLSDSVTLFRAVAGNLVSDWRERLSPRGLRCFALVERILVDDFKHQVASARLPSDVVARVSGPWPASEFVEKI